MNAWRGTRLPFKPGHRKDVEIFLDEKMLLEPLRWKKPRMIFVCSMTDLFADFVRDEWIDRMFAVMALCPQHRFQVLTKRAKRMREYFAGIPEMNEPAARDALIEGSAQSIYSKLHPDEGDCSLWLAVHAPLKNVWLGVSAEDQANADARIPELLATPAAVRFVSLEPLLGAIDLMMLRQDEKVFDAVQGAHAFRDGDAWEHAGTCAKLDWVIVGGESGPHARPMHPDWTRSLRDQCQAAGVPFFFKQWGQWHADALLFTDLEGRSPPPAMRVGKKRAGRLLDGVEHNGMP